MGIEIKRNNKGEYQVRSSNTGELLHDGDKEWITEEEAKGILITRAYFDFIETVIKIDGNFPSGYMTSDLIIMGGEKNGTNFIYDCYNDDENCDRKLFDKYQEIMKKHKCL